MCHDLQVIQTESLQPFSNITSNGRVEFRICNETFIQTFAFHFPLIIENYSTVINESSRKSNDISWASVAYPFTDYYMNIYPRGRALLCT